MENIKFSKLPTNTKALLQEIVESNAPVKLLQKRFESCSPKESDILRGVLRELVEMGFISIQWVNNVPKYIALNNSARTYFERESEYEKQLKASLPTSTNVYISNGKNIQIQQNSDNSSQTMSIEEMIDFDKAVEVFNHVLEKAGEFNLDTKDVERLLNVVNEAHPKAVQKKDGKHVKKALAIVREILTSVTGSLAAAGILHLISQMGI